MNLPETHKRLWVDAPTHRTAKMQAAAEGVTLEAYIRRLVLEDVHAVDLADSRR